MEDSPMRRLTRNSVTHASRPSNGLLVFHVVLAALVHQDAARAASPPERVIGFYHWGGQHSTSMSQGIEQISKLGSRIARVTLSPRYYSDYNSGVGCYPNFSLITLAQEHDVKLAFGNNSIDIFMITAYD